ncbi:hypothetical protein TNCV_473351 [Trichonephila clavipes]|nr:hypothetical protein TNCV_473351 [Trichonephila clavipes]
MDSRLRKLKALWGKKKHSDGKTIGGKGRLTDAIISKLTTFYGNAIRAKSHNVNEMGPKLIGSGINVTKIAAFIAACEYNDGSKNRIDLMRALNLKINKTNVLNCVNIDKVRKSTVKRQVSKTSFEARKAKKLKILKQIEQCKLAEGNISAAGTF